MLDTLKKSLATYIEGFKKDADNADMSLDCWYDLQEQVNEITSALISIVIIEKYLKEEGKE